MTLDKFRLNTAQKNAKHYRGVKMIRATQASIVGLTVILAGCTTDGRTDGNYRLQDVVLSNGSTFSPQATPDSSCDVLRAEDNRIKRLVGKDSLAFAKKGPGELAVLKYHITISETRFFKCEMKKG